MTFEALFAARGGEGGVLAQHLGGVAHGALQRWIEQAGRQQPQPVDIAADLGDLSIRAVGADGQTLAGVLERRAYFLDGFVQARRGRGRGQLLLERRQPVFDLLDRIKAHPHAVELDRCFRHAAEQCVHLRQADADAVERLHRRRPRIRVRLQRFVERLDLRRDGIDLMQQFADLVRSDGFRGAAIGRQRVFHRMRDLGNPR